MFSVAWSRRRFTTASARSAASDGSVTTAGLVNPCEVVLVVQALIHALKFSAEGGKANQLADRAFIGQDCHYLRSATPIGRFQQAAPVHLGSEVHKPVNIYDSLQRFQRLQPALRIALRWLARRLVSTARIRSSGDSAA